MRSVFLLLLVCFLICIVDAQQKSGEGKRYDYNYNYYKGVQPGYNYGYQAADPRLFFTRQTVYTRTTTTSTTTFTCTKSTSSACATGRKRRGVLLEEDNEEQFLVTPTAVQG